MENTPKILNIKSDKTELKKVEFFLSEYFNENELPLKNFNRVLLCISEAVVNSIDHGNRNDDDKNVSIEITRFKEKIDIRISDEGCGFDHANLGDPTAQQNLKKEAGRGIHIIKSLSDSLEFRNKGKCVRFKVKVCE